MIIHLSLYVVTGRFQFVAARNRNTNMSHALSCSFLSWRMILCGGISPNLRKEHLSRWSRLRLGIICRNKNTTITCYNSDSIRMWATSGNDGSSGLPVVCTNRCEPKVGHLLNIKYGPNMPNHLNVFNMLKCCWYSFTSVALDLDLTFRSLCS